MQTMTYSRTYAWSEPANTYRVTDETTGRPVGYVARAGRRWHASNKSWTTGGDLVGTFDTRHAASVALRHIADGRTTAATYGGYVPETSCRACRALLFRDDGPRDRSPHLAADVRVMTSAGPWKTSTGAAHCHYSDDGAHVPS